MKTKPVILRNRAARDVDETIAHYLGEASAQVASRFIDALERATSHLGRHPASGSSRYAQELGLAGLRGWPLNRFPHVIFYFDREDHVDVWRILHGRRDIPAWLREPSS